jgi:rod shape-determining protein MreD
MRWLAFAIVTGCILVLQTTLAHRVAIRGTPPDWILVWAVFCGLYAQRRDAVLAGFSIGLCADLMSIERLGVLAIAYATTAMLVNSIRHLVFLKNATTHFFVTLVAGTLLHAALSAYQVALYGSGSIGWTEGVRSAILIAAYTAVWAVVAQHLLLKLSSTLGLHTSRYGHGRMHHTVGSRV